MDASERNQVLAEARRFLEDLCLFDGASFIAPQALTGVQDGPAPVAVAAEPPPEPAPVPAAGERAAGLEAFRQEICNCTRCPLGQTRQRFVFGDGDPEAGILFVGEGPGEEEDRQGLPFVGAAGQLLTKIIEAMKMRRDQVYICNTVKCRPPGNRTPSPEELQACEPYLARQIEIIQPRIICALGRTAAQVLLQESAPLNALRGRLHSYRGIPVVVTYHPAALLRHAEWNR
ncbi:MAG: uracil-DNA glycosylase, partial [Candidatus Latescibacteria bacterium]|nr:uracil-DNA glycosylase [Candidatus Latescibacterota bacterium]